MNSTSPLSTLHRSNPGIRTRTARRIAAACGAGVLLLGAGACGSDDPQQAAATTADAGTGPTTSQQGSGRPPGVNGTVAAVADDTAQVQSSDSGQVAVSWTSSTTFTKQVAASLSDVAVGDCVMVTSETTGSAPSADQTTPPAPPAEVTATSVRISEPVDGSCTPAGGPGSGQGPSGQGPSGQPPAAGQVPGGTPPDGARFRGFAGAFGTVTSVGATGFEVSSTRPALGEAAAETTTVTVTVVGATTYTTTAEGSAADVKVGQCVRAEGAADDTGAVTATAIAVTPPVDGGCGTMRRFDGGGAGTTGQAS